MNMEKYPTTEELAKEAMRILKESPRMTPQEHIEFLVQRGIIDRKGRVICMKLFGDGPTQEPDEAKPDPSTNGQ
jgi:hypothetical protein